VSWYGIGIIASAFGADYIWKEKQAPAIRPKFGSVKEALDYRPAPVSQTRIGRHTLDMIDYFPDKTGGRVPMSLTDTQSPLAVEAGDETDCGDVLPELRRAGGCVRPHI
jgi:hypothetical protein